MNRRFPWQSPSAGLELYIIMNGTGYHPFFPDSANICLPSGILFDRSGRIIRNQQRKPIDSYVT